jgi:hypothetical protein
VLRTYECRGGWLVQTVAAGEGKRKVFFFEKKNQKTFAAWARSCLGLRAQVAKVFCFFSSEKKTLLLARA